MTGWRYMDDGDSRLWTPQRIWVTVLVVLLSVLFFRSVVPRIPRLFLRGRLRVKRLGIRGVRVIEWRSDGFKSPRKASDASDKSSYGDDDPTASSGLAVRVDHIYMTLRWRQSREPDESSNSGDVQDEDSARPSQTWLTLHVDGVGVTLPKAANRRSPSEQERQNRRAEKMEEEGRRAAEEEEKRLQELMISRPSSPAVGGVSSGILGGAPEGIASMPAFSAALGLAQNIGEPEPLPSTLRAMPLQYLQSTTVFVRSTLIPTLVVIMRKTIRAFAYLAASLLPLLSSIIDIEVQRIEVYDAQRDVVVRLTKLRLDAQLDIVGPSRKEAEKCDRAAYRCASLRQRMAAALSSMPNRLGSGARGAASLFVDGMPGLHANLRLTSDGLQVFDALRARRVGGSRRSTGGGETDRAKRWSLYDDQPALASPVQTPSVQGQDWQSFSSLATPPIAPKLTRTVSTGEVMKESKKGKGVDSRSKWSGRWVDWALRTLPSGSQGLLTGWHKGIVACQEGPVPIEARILATKGSTSIKLGLVIGKFVSSKESLHVDVALAAITTGGESIIVLNDRLRQSKAAHQQSDTIPPRSPPASKANLAGVLQTLGSVRVSMPLFQIDLSSKSAFDAMSDGDNSSTDGDSRDSYMPSSLQALMSFIGFNASLATIAVPDDVHQRFLGSCGVEGFGAAAARKAFTDGLRWTLGRRRLVYIEDRRVFAFKAGLDGVQVRLGVDGQPLETQSEVAHISEIQIDARSTWSPAGLISAANAPEGGLLRFFAGDPNEEAMVVDAKLGKATGDVKSAHLFALLAFLRGKQAQRARAREDNRALENEVRSPPTAPLTGRKSPVQIRRVPRFVVGLEIRNVGYRIDATSVLLSDAPKPLGNEPYLGLVLEIPHVQLNATGEYEDQLVRRAESERKAAWKALARNELEWSLHSGSAGVHHNTPNPNILKKDQAAAKVDRSDWRRGGLDSGSDSPLRPEQDDDVEEQGGSLTMLEAIKRMHKLQPNVGDKPAKSSPSQARNRRQSNKGTRAALFPSHSHTFKVATRGAFESVKLFWVMDGDDVSSMRRAKDGEERNPTVMARLPSHARTHRHIVGMRNFEALSNIRIPAQQEESTNTMNLRVSDQIVDVCTSLGEVDMDMWHPSSLDATKHLLAGIQRSAAKLYLRPSGAAEGRNRKSRRSDAMNLEDAVSDTEHGPEAPPSSDAPEASPQPALIDVLPGNTSVYFSIGSFVALIGGLDERCDRNLSRGVGLEVKGLVAQMATSATDHRRSFEPLHFALNARSALGLTEDQRAAVAALAVRHGRAATAKLIVHNLGVFPLLDAQMATTQHLDSEDAADVTAQLATQHEVHSPLLIAPALWDFQETRPHAAKARQTRPQFRQQDRSNYIISLPNLAVRANLVPRGSKADKVGSRTEELTVVTENTPLLSFKIELLHTYCILVALSSMKNLIPPRNRRSKEMSRPKRKRRTTFAVPSFHAAFTIDEVHVHILLPCDVKMFLSIQRLEAIHGSAGHASVGFEWLLAAVESAEVPSRDQWEEMVRIRDCKVRYEAASREKAMRVVANADGMRIRIPFNYVVHPIIDNTVVAVKATKQLLHQFLLDAKQSVIMPVAEGPKHLPVLDFHIRILSVEAEDDPFETRLNIIWRSGGDENQARAERESAFEQKLQLIERTRTPHNASQQSLSTSSAAVSSSSTSDNEGEEETARRSEVNTSADEARDRLHAFNGSSWKRRFVNAKAEQARREDASKRRIYGRLPPNPCAMQNGSLPIKLAAPSRAAPLIRSTMINLHLTLSPTSFPESHLRTFLKEQGGGVPESMEYSLLLPMNVHLRLDEWKIALRDYPMPLMHVPPINRHTQPDTLAALELQMDCCVAEQLGGEEALRHVTAIVVPASTGQRDAIEYGISVPRMAMPTKFFGSPSIEINSSFTTRLVWGQSYQPAIHDVVRVFEGITSPPHDPSPKIGFWDKLPLILQGKLQIRFTNDGQFHVYLKGSRDPYHILGHGAGWVKCWRENVDIRVGFENEQREVFQIISDEYILAIPDLKDYIDRAATGTEYRDPTSADADHEDDKGGKKDKSKSAKSAATVSSSLISSQTRYMREPEFKKITLKLTNGVRWGFGLLLERTCSDSCCQCSPRCKGEPFYRECRFWDRKPHWQVYTRSREYVESLPKDQQGDSYAGWRSDHLHFSVSIYSPADSNTLRREKFRSGVPGTVNNMYFTPLAWEHFWAWMRLFDSALSLPIRQGKLFPRSLEQSPKFGRHLGTIKYRFDISPLYVSHVYPQDEKHDWARGRTTLVGVKARMSTFHMDLHQRQQEAVSDRPELGGLRKHFHKPFYEADIDLTNINFRTLAGQFQEPEKSLYPFHDLDDDNDESTIFDDDDEDDAAEENLEWYDLHDFVELDWAPPVGGKAPRVRLIEAMTCPRFNYYRRIDSKGERKERKDAKKTLDSEEDASRLENTKFGHENTHSCLVGTAPSPPKVQVSLAEDRLSFLKNELRKSRSEGTGEPASAAYMGEARAKEEDEKASGHAAKKERDLHRKIKLVEDYIQMLHGVEEAFDKRHEPDADVISPKTIEHMVGLNPYTKELIREWEAFDNSYFIHNPIIFYSNATRDALLKYYMSSRKRRGVVHSLSARAVRYIRNLANSSDEAVNGPLRQERLQSTSTAKSDSTMHASKDGSGQEDEADALDDIARVTMEALKSHRAGKKKDDGGTDNLPKAGDDSDKRAFMDSFDPHEGISDDFEVRKSNVCVVLKPQIVLRSVVSDTSTVIITAARARLQNYSVIDPRMEEDSVNERVLYRNLVGVDALQGFHPNARCTFTNPARERSGFVYVPLETLVDMRHETSEFDRIAPRTDATVQYDKFNKLRMHDPNHPVVASAQSDGDKDYDPGRNDHLRHAMDLIRVRCPRYSIAANAEQFGAIYNVVTDLLLYRDPAYREHAKKLDMMMFNYDLTDILTLADIVQSMQVRNRHARELHTQYQLHFENLNEQGRLDFLTLKAELHEMQDDLNLLLEAITQAADHSDKDKEKKSALRLDAQAQDVAWNMMGGEEGHLLAKLSIRGASFTWLNKADNSVANSLSVLDLNAVNVDPDAVFQEIITKYHIQDEHPMKQSGMLINASWSVLAPVGGIAMVDHFELHLHPLRIQIERKVGRQIEEYIFGSMREKRREREEQEESQRQQDNTGGGKGKNGGAGEKEEGKDGRKRTVSMRLKRLKGVFHTGHHSNKHPHAGDKADNRNDDSGPPSPRNGNKPLPPSRRSSELRRSMTLHRAPSRRSLLTDDGKPSRSASFLLSSNASSLGGTTLASGSASALNSGDDGQGHGAGGGGAQTDSEEENGQRAIAARNALEMRERASRNVTFVSVKVSQTIFCLSYKSEKQKSIMDLYDLEFRAPRLDYRNRTWTHADLASHLKRDIIKAAWKQRSTLIKGVISHKRPPATQRVAQAALTLARSRPTNMPSLGVRSHSPSVTDEKRKHFRPSANDEQAASPKTSSAPATGNAGGGSNAVALSSGERSHDSQSSRRRSNAGDAPEFRYHVDPPSFSDSGSRSMSKSGLRADSTARDDSSEDEGDDPGTDEDQAVVPSEEESEQAGNDSGPDSWDGQGDYNDDDVDERNVLSLHDSGHRRRQRHGGRNSVEEMGGGGEGDAHVILSDVGEEAEVASSHHTNAADRRSSEHTSRFRFGGGSDVSRNSSKSSNNQSASSHGVPGAAVAFASTQQQKLGRLLAKTLHHKRRGDHSPTKSNGSAAATETHDVGLTEAAAAAAAARSNATTEDQRRDSVENPSHHPSANANRDEK